MNVTQPGRSATIHQFPNGGRNGARSVRDVVTSTVVRPARFAPKIMAEGGWYQDEAMREEAQQSAEPRKPN